MMNNNNIRPFPFQEKSWWTQILDPGGRIVTQWQQTFLVTCLIALFVDPLYFYLPMISGPACMQIDIGLGISVTFFRTVADLFYLAHIIIKFRIAYVAPTSRVFGRGVLVTDPHQIALRYLKTDFIVDFAATLPLPQVVIWYIIPSIKDPTADHANHIISLIVLIQYIPRLFLIFPLNRQIMRNSGIVARTAWLGAAYNLLLYTLASHVLGAIWYLLAIERNHECWKDECDKETNVTAFPVCRPSFLDCSSLSIPERQVWLNFTQLLTNCQPHNNVGFLYGMYGDMLIDDVASSTFLEKFFYCLWWGLRSLSSYGQSVSASFFSSETLFCIVICIGGLVLFSDLIGNMQTYLQNMGIRLEEWRVRRRDTEEWMRHRQLPPDLQERIRRFVQYKWIATRGVDEEAILRELPLDIRREIQRHLCLALVLRVPFFSQMDDQLLDAICERLVSSLSTQDAYIVREGDPVNEMLFIIRGQLESSTTNGGRSGFFNSITLRPGDFCGEELLTWALMPHSSLSRPISTRTVKSITKVEAFALRADDLTFVANQFKRLHSKKLQHAFRYYSHQWRTWGACFIQAAWRRMKRKRLAQELARQESLYYMQLSDQEGYFDETMDADYAGSSAETSSMENPHGGQHIGATILASRFAANARKGAQKKVQFKAVTSPASSLKMPKLFKPEEPDFSADS